MTNRRFSIKTNCKPGTAISSDPSPHERLNRRTRVPGKSRHQTNRNLETTTKTCIKSTRYPHRCLFVYSLNTLIYFHAWAGSQQCGGRRTGVRNRLWSSGSRQAVLGTEPQITASEMTWSMAELLESRASSVNPLAQALAATV